MTASENNPNIAPSDPNDEEDTLDMEMALLALSTSDVGGPIQEINLDTLSNEEKRALLSYMRHRFNLAPDPEELSEKFEDEQESAPDSPNHEAV